VRGDPARDFHSTVVEAHPTEEFSVDEVLSRIWQSLDARVNGPLMFRLIMQPLIAAALAVREGLADADAGKPAYFWALLTRPAERRQLLREGWTAVVKVFVLAAILETVYELIVYGRIYPFEALLVSFVLACVPYILIRGPVNRIAASTRRTRSSF